MKNVYRKRLLAGVLAILMCLNFMTHSSLTLQAASETETAAFEESTELFTEPVVETVGEETEVIAELGNLTEEEKVQAEDISIPLGADFQVKDNFTGLKANFEKVQITLKGVKGSDGTELEFDVNTADTYFVTYLVQPYSGKASYEVTRKIAVLEQEPETTGPELPGQNESSGAENEFPQDLLPEVTEPTESEKVTEPVTEPETTLEEVLEEAERQELSFGNLKPGESLTFYMSTGMTRAVTAVTVTKAATPYYYSDYGYGTYLTYRYTVSFNDIKATAYCIEPSKASPESGSGYTVTKMTDGKALAKVCYYGTKASAGNGFFEEKHPGFTEGQKFIITHLAAAYASGSSDAFSGANEKGRSMAMELYNYCMDQPAIPDVDMSFSDPDVKAYISGNIQRTKSINFKADAAQSITFKLPSGVKLHNETTGKTSKAGAEVVVSGGTKFYLSAPLTQATDVAKSWKTTMRGAITKDFTAYKITTGGNMQNLALVFGEGVDDEKYIDFRVTWVEQAKVTVNKVDADTNDKLSGAIFELYRDSSCTDLIMRMPATDAQGSAFVEFAKTQDTVYLKEITAPKGYRINTTVYNVKLIIGGNVTITVPNGQQLGNITIYKEGPELVGADATNTGITFCYETRRLEGAVYSVWAGDDIVSPTGQIVYKKGSLIADNLTTGSDGSVSLNNLNLGTYLVKEEQAPENFYNDQQSKTVTLSYAGQDAEAAFSNTTFQNDRQRAQVQVVKQDNETSNPLSGAQFSLYAGNDIKNADGTIIVQQGTLIETVTTGTAGGATFSAELPIGNSYYVKETKAPIGYLRNQDDIFTFNFQYTNDKDQSQIFAHTFSNQRVTARIVVHKIDDELMENKGQGDAKLSGAVYGLYARADIMHPDGRTGVMYRAGEQVSTLTTDSQGNASVSGLYLGAYYVKELSASEGYLIDNKEYDLICSYENDLVAEIVRETTSPEHVKKQPFCIIKVSENGETDAPLLEGAGFTAYLQSSLAIGPDGAYDFAGATPVVIGQNGATEIFTDRKGYVESIPIPYGTYIVRETTTPKNHKPVKDFVVKITENKPDEPQVWRVLLDKAFTAKLKIIKKDDETGQPVLIPDAEFKIYNMDTGEYVEQVTTYPVTTVHTSFFTDSSGSLTLPQNLKVGHYRVEEITAPDGYTINPNHVEISVESDTIYQIDPISGDVIIEVEYENHPVKGEMHIVKKGELIKDYTSNLLEKILGKEKDFVYELGTLEGATFNFYAAEDIYTADYQQTNDGNRVLEYAQGALVASVTTDEKGEATVKDLPLGTYKVVEVLAPNGFTHNAEEIKVTFAYVDQDTPVIVERAEFVNERQKVEITVVKKDAENDATLEGAEFGLYAKQDIINHAGEIIVPKDTLLSVARSGVDGRATFVQDLPLGDYYVKELQMPAGYTSSQEVIEIQAHYQGQEIKTVKIEKELQNKPTKTEFVKTDIASSEELEGATLTVLDSEGKVIETWTSKKGEPHIIKCLEVGKTYTLREEIAPYGYLKAQEIEFTVQDNTDMQRVEMKDEVPTGTLIINKNGEFLEEITLLDTLPGIIEHAFHYLTGNLTNVTFEVYAAEDIKHADGVSEDYYKKDKLIDTIKTDTTGIATLEGLPCGKYYVVEKETEDGFVLDGERREIDLSYRDQDTPIITFSSDWLNGRQKVEIEVKKLDKETKEGLAGGVFALYAKEDILSASGKVLLEAEKIIEQRATDEDGILKFKADLPVNYTYCIKEIKAPAGYVTSDSTKEFRADYQEGQDFISTIFEVENEQTQVEVSKKDITTNKELLGATLKVLDEQGNIVEEWTSSDKPHILKKLEVGKTYRLQESIPAPGYVTAKEIAFTISNTSEIQKVEMVDDTTKLEISKTDITGEQEVPGAKLCILDSEDQVMEEWTSTNKPHYVEKLPIGSYTLREEIAPKGYVIARDVSFEIKDTAEIQKVSMQNDTAHGKLIINKTSKETGKPLKGVEFELRDESGKTLEKLVTDAAGHAESQEYEIATYKGGKFAKELVYILVETKTVEGYQLDSTEQKIQFSYVDQYTPIVEVTKEITNVKESQDTPGAPGVSTSTNSRANPVKTGDKTDIFVPLLAAITSMGVVIGLWLKKRKKKR